MHTWSTCVLGPPSTDTGAGRAASPRWWTAQNSRPAGERSTTTWSSRCSTVAPRHSATSASAVDVIGVQVEVATSRAGGNPLHPQVGVAVGRDQRGELAALTPRSPTASSPVTAAQKAVVASNDGCRPVEERRDPADRHRASVGTGDAKITR